MVSIGTQMECIIANIAKKCSSSIQKPIIAFSGGVDSSLVASLVYKVYPETSVSCLGISPSVSKFQIEQARHIAKWIGIPLLECPTTEGNNPKYIENIGQSCYYCKADLYTTINHIATFASEKFSIGGAKYDADGSMPHNCVIFNGTNADDHLDPTRLGLIAANEFHVQSPISSLTKSQVREMAKYIGLPNWNAAASPCLRSRLQFGVEATEEHLERIEKGEKVVRKLLQLPIEANMRVRFLAGNRCAVEVDTIYQPLADNYRSEITLKLCQLGFEDVKIRPFKSGSISDLHIEIPCCMDRLCEDIRAIPSLENITDVHLSNLNWKTKEIIFVSLFSQHAPSEEVVKKLKECKKDRYFERKAERLDEKPLEIVRKNEDNYRVGFMQLVATELARLGAPATMSWQKLIYDSECCAMAYRLLLTKIKSNKRAKSSIRNHKTFNPRASLKNNTVQDLDTRQPWSTDTTIGDTEQIYTPVSEKFEEIQIKDEIIPLVSPSSPAASSTSSSNYDRSKIATPSCRMIRNQEQCRDKYSSSAQSSQRKKSSLVSKVKGTQLHSLQQNNLQLHEENEILLDKVKHMESLLAVYQDEAEKEVFVKSSNSWNILFSQFQLLKVRNMQLQRRLQLTETTLCRQETTKVTFLNALNEWKELIATASNDAQAFRSYTPSTDNNNNVSLQSKKYEKCSDESRKWIMAVPHILIEDLTRLEHQIESSLKPDHDEALESDYWLSSGASSFTNKTLPSAMACPDIYNTGSKLSQSCPLRLDFTQQLQNNLILFMKKVEEMQFVDGSTFLSKSVNSRHSIKPDNKEQLLDIIRAIIVDLGVVGSVVPQTHDRYDHNHVIPDMKHYNVDLDAVNLSTIIMDLKALLQPTSRIKGNTKLSGTYDSITYILHNLEARVQALEKLAQSCQTEVKYWRNAWKIQEDLMNMAFDQATLGVGKQIECVEKSVLSPLQQLSEVVDAFIQQQESMKSNSVRENPLANVLLENLQENGPKILQGVKSCKIQYCKLLKDNQELIEDFQHNCNILLAS